MSSLRWYRSNRYGTPSFWRCHATTPNGSALFCCVTTARLFLSTLSAWRRNRRGRGRFIAGTFSASGPLPVCPIIGGGVVGAARPLSCKNDTGIITGHALPARSFDFRVARVFVLLLRSGGQVGGVRYCA